MARIYEPTDDELDDMVVRAKRKLIDREAEKREARAKATQEELNRKKSGGDDGTG